MSPSVFRLLVAGRKTSGLCCVGCPPGWPPIQARLRELWDQCVQRPFPGIFKVAQLRHHKWTDDFQAGMNVLLLHSTARASGCQQASRAPGRTAV